MKQQGITDSQIQNILTNEGVSPREIVEAVSQYKIKNAVASEGGLQQSIMTDSNQQQYMSVPESSAPSPTMQQYTQQAQAQPVYQQQEYAPQQAQQQTYDPQQYAQQQGYDQQVYAQQGYMPQVLDIETVRDISKQQVEESLKRLKEEISSLSKLKSEIKFEIQDIENRLKKVEEIMHEMQSAIIRKIGEYGESIQGISKEIRATQESFAKVINPLVDKKRGIIQKYSDEPEQQEPIQDELKSQIKSKKQPPTNSGSREQGSASFEDYFR
jgi:hypothetical protein